MAALCHYCCSILPDAAPACPVYRPGPVVLHPALFRLTIAHVDCDAFCASVEKRDQPDLASRPVIVGGGTRGVVSAACHVARLHGAKNAMPKFRALKACLDAVAIRSDFEKYTKASRAVRATPDRLFAAARGLLAREATGTAFRLIGIGANPLTPRDRADHGDLADTEAPRVATAQTAIDLLRDRFGEHAVIKGRALHPSAGRRGGRGADPTVGAKPPSLPPALPAVRRSASLPPQAPSRERSECASPSSK